MHFNFGHINGQTHAQAFVKNGLSAKNTWNALAQVWSAPFEETPGLQC